MQTSQKALLLHDDLEALALIERIRQRMAARQNKGEPSLEGNVGDKPVTREEALLS